LQATIAQLKEEFREFKELIIENLLEPEPEPEIEWLPLAKAIQKEIAKGTNITSEVIYRIVRKAESFPKESAYKVGIHFKRVNCHRIWISSEFWKVYYGEIDL
jgi:hypothetical protein